MYVFFKFCQVTQSTLACDMQVRLHARHESHISCAVCKPYVLHVLHASQHSHVLHVRTAILCQIRTKAYNGIACKQNMIKFVDMQKIVFCQIYTYVRTYVPLLQSTLDDIVWHHLNTKHDNGTRLRQQDH